MLVVVMGVAGSGKSTVAELLSARTGCQLAEGDEFHPPSNIAMLTSGNPLDDLSRAPWLTALRSWLAQRAAHDECAVLSCSALTRAYRDILRSAGPDVRMVHLAGPREVVAQRLAQREGHFMAPELLDSQYAELEPLEPDEPGITVDLTAAPERIVEEVLRAFAPNT